MRVRRLKEYTEKHNSTQEINQGREIYHIRSYGFKLRLSS
jgi:hypothetical protein